MFVSVTFSMYSVRTSFPVPFLAKPYSRTSVISNGVKLLVVSSNARSAPFVACSVRRDALCSFLVTSCSTGTHWDPGPNSWSSWDPDVVGVLPFVKVVVAVFGRLKTLGIAAQNPAIVPKFFLSVRE